MSIVQLNIRTRIELETRVLAAALKQSFERGDSDGVSLAHRQLFLLLKDQKAGNGGSAAPETTPTGTNGGGESSIREAAIEEAEEQPVYVPESYAESDVSEPEQAPQPSLEVTDYQAEAGAGAEVEVEEAADDEEAEDDLVAGQGQETYEAQKIEAAVEETDHEQAHAVAQYLKYKQTRDHSTGEEDETSDNIQPSEPPKPLSEEEEYIRMRKAPPVAKEVLPFDQPSAEYAEIFGSTVIDPPSTSAQASDGSAEAPYNSAEAPHSSSQAPHSSSEAPYSSAAQMPHQTAPFYNPNIEAGPFDALPEPPSYGQFISSTPPSSPESQAIAAPAAEGKQTSTNVTGEFEPAIEARNRKMGHDSAQSVEPDYMAEALEQREEQVVEQVAVEPVAVEQVAVEQVAVEQVAGEQVAETTSHDADAQSVEQPGQTTEDDEEGEQSAEQQYTQTAIEPEPEQVAAAATSDSFAPVPESSDLPAEFRRPPAQEFPKLMQNTTQDLPMVGKDLPPAGQGLTQDLPQVEQPAVQGSPQEFGDIRSQQAADYALRKANQSTPRNMPAIDFSLQSEAKSAEIDFTQQSESNRPDIDFTLQSTSNKPDIDFSLQSESNSPQSESSRPNIDFSLQSENQQQLQNGALSAPTGGGFIEAEFVSSDAEPTAEDLLFEEQDTLNQDVTSELPILNPTASLYLAPHETSEAPTQVTAGEPAETPVAPPPPAMQEPPKSTVPFTGMPMLVAPNHSAPPAVAPPAATPPPVPPLDGIAAAVTTSREEPLPPAPPKPPDLYAMLGVSQMSPFEEIHKNFLRKIRKILLRLRGAVRPERDELLKELRRHWVARDILCDPVTRTDYDFRDMGLRGSPDGTVPHVEDGPQRIGQRTPLRIGELLQCAGLLEQAELEIACDMHKAMPEVQFGTFLVRQGFIQERDLDSVLLGQTLLRDGKITVAQFQVAMELSQSRGANISDTLIEHGYITAAELAQLTEKSAEAHDSQSSETPTIKEVAVKPRQVDATPSSSLQASSAVPTWKDQLDWSKPLPVDDDASLMDRNPEKQSLADLLGNVNSEPNSDPDKVKISNNAAPSWKDQLDWEQPQDTPPADATTNSAAKEAQSGEQNIPSDETQTPISLAHAVPSWKDQLDWEQPKEETQPPSEEPGQAENDEEYDDDEPMIHSSKETQPISIYPPTSVAPIVTLGQGNLGTASDTNTQSSTEEKYLQEIIQATDIFDQSIGSVETEAGQTEDSSDEHDAEEHEPDEEHPSEEHEGFFKKSLNKLKKGDPKDKKKKRK